MMWKEDKDEIIAHEWMTLKLLWDRCKANAANKQDHDKIDALFSEQPKWSSQPQDWYALNQAEQIVGAYLDQSQLAVEYRNLLDLARTRKLSTISRYEKDVQVFATTKTDSLTLERQRDVYLALLYVLQSHFVEARFQRRLRSETAGRLLHIGLSVLCLVALVPVIFAVSSYWSASTTPLAPGDVATGHQLVPGQEAFRLIMVAAFGILGAYFSRIMSFHSKLSTFGFDDAMKLYLTQTLLLRLLYGMIGAIIFYYFLCSGLIDGSAFPKLSGVTVGTSKKEFGLAELDVLAPTLNLAKLLVWSFIAGFSERLVPTTLDRVDQQAKKTDGH